MALLNLCCPCLFGLESVLSGEIRRLGADDIVVTDGKVCFSGDETMVAKANIMLRTAERVLIVLGTFKATSFVQLFDETERLPFEDFIGSRDAFPVKGWSLNSGLYSIPDCQSIIKKAAVKRLGKIYNKTWFEESGSVHQIQFSIHKDIVNIMLDTSGPGLHKRGYRENANIAPIKETLAAGIVDLARLRENDIVYDPFCGSGTFLIEAAYNALNIAPGMKRHFAAEEWDVFKNNMWTTVRQTAKENIKRDGTFKATGYDNDYEAINLSADNAMKSGVGPRIKSIKQSIAEFTCDDERATILCNPPYGERLLELEEAEDIYRTMGRVFEQRKFLSYYIISPHENFEQLFGRPADKRRKLYNGMIKCQLFMYFKSH